MTRKKYWEEFTDSDFLKIGYKSGIETHQQLLTSKKLFCNCPAGLTDKPVDAQVLRHMRPTMSELGEYDGTALMEFKTRKTVIYQLIRDHVCTYEMDDTPPFLMNQDALDIALCIAMMLDCSIVDEIHISRKQYLDGSIPTGFQRTAIVGVGGSIPVNGLDVDVTYLTIEEDSCREVLDDGHEIVFKADRLNTPLIEVVTEPQARTPRETRMLAEQVHRLLFASGRVRREIGATRSDVNVSIDGTTRVEIKGVNRLRYMERLCYIEALRQKVLLDIRDELQSRGLTPENLECEKHIITDIFPVDKFQFMKKELKSDGEVGAIIISGFRGILDWPTQPDTTFASEFAGRIKVIACLDWNSESKTDAFKRDRGREKLRNLIYSDDNNSVLSSSEWDEIKRITHAGKDDAVCLLWGPREDVKTALEEIFIRAQQAALGVPNETRQAYPDCTTGFERILPGADRMYPDTDLPPTVVESIRLEKVKSELPEKPWEVERRYAEMGVHPEVYRDFVLSPQRELAESIIKEMDLDPTIVIVTLDQTMKHLRREKYDVDSIEEADIRGLFLYLICGIFTRDAFPILLKYLAENPDKDAADAVLDLDLQMIGEADLQNVANEMIKKDGVSRIKDLSKRTQFLLGKIMDRVRGKAHHQDVMELIEEHVK